MFLIIKKKVRSKLNSATKCRHKKLLYFLFQLTTTFVNEIASRIPEEISNIKLLPADIILVAKSLGKCLEKGGLVTESNSVC